MWCDFTLFVILGSLFSINAGYAVIAPFVPIIFVQKGIAVSYIGLSISLYALSYTILGLFVGSWMGSIGRRRTLLIGSSLLGLSFLLNSLLVFMHDSTWFLWFTMSFRVLQGVGAAFLNVSTYSIATARYSDSIDSVMTMIKLATGIGLVSGPAIGSTFFSFLGYAGPFAFFAIIFALLAFFAYISTPDSVEDEMPNGEADMLNAGNTRLSYQTIQESIPIEEQSNMNTNS